MRKLVAVAAASALFLGSSQVPASAAGPEAPTDVQVSWADVAKKTVRITWKDNGEKNYLGYEIDGIPFDPTPGAWQEAAGGDNDVVVTIGEFLSGRTKLRLLVWSQDAAQGVSDRTPSVWFDTQYAALPVLKDAEALADQSLRITWQTPELDITPDDPLDRPAGEALLSAARWANTAEQPTESFPVPAGATTTTIPPRPRPYDVRFQTTNEWGTRTWASPLTFATMTAGLQVEPLAVYGQTASIQMIAGAQNCLTPGPCDYKTDARMVSLLQSRANPTQPWKTIGTFSNRGPKIYLGVTAYGGTEFRTYVQAWKQLSPTSELIVAPAASTSARYTAVQPEYRYAGFDKSRALVSEVVTTKVEIRPGVTRASLQVLDGKTWRYVAPIVLKNGIGTYKFKAAGRGTTKTYRVALPKLTVNGLPLVASGSTSFTLTVR